MTTNHFKQRITSPILSITSGYLYLTFLGIMLYLLGFYENNDFFRWGTPIKFFGHNITDPKTFYSILALLFVHQLINNWINDVTYPWIINCIQDPKSKYLQYSKTKSLLLVNLFSIYSSFDGVLFVAGMTSQISFSLIINLANAVSISIINWQYIKKKISISPFNINLDYEDIEDQSDISVGHD